MKKIKEIVISDCSYRDVDITAEMTTVLEENRKVFNKIVKKLATVKAAVQINDTAVIFYLIDAISIPEGIDIAGLIEEKNFDIQSFSFYKGEKTNGIAICCEKK